MKAVYLSLGSNVNPEQHIPRAIELLKKNFNVLRVSSVYETDPVGPAGSSKFWNLAVAIQVKSSDPLLPKIREIETALGRTRAGNKFSPRTMDIDILPQTDYQKLAFVMIPLAEIAPDEKDPQTGKSFEEIAEKFREEAKSFKKIL